MTPLETTAFVILCFNCKIWKLFFFRKRNWFFTFEKSKTKRKSETKRKLKRNKKKLKRNENQTKTETNFVLDLTTPGKVYEWSNFQNLPLTKFDLLKFLKFFYKTHEIFCFFISQCIYKEKMFSIEIEDGREAP